MFSAALVPCHPSGDRSSEPITPRSPWTSSGSFGNLVKSRGFFLETVEVNLINKQIQGFYDGSVPPLLLHRKISVSSVVSFCASSVLFSSPKSLRVLCVLCGEAFVVRSRKPLSGSNNHIITPIHHITNTTIPLYLSFFQMTSFL